MKPSPNALLGQNPRGRSVAYIVRSYPRLSQTFILDEILMLEMMGVNLRIFAVTDPHEPIVQMEVSEVQAPTYYLDTVRRKWFTILAEHFLAAMQSPRRYARALHFVRTHKDGDDGYSASTRYECFAYAVYLARLLKREELRTGVGTGHLHAHFAHDPTLVAMLTHMLTGISYSFTAHARDLYQVPPAVLLERAERASAIVTCCKANVEYLNKALPRELSDKVRLIYHGKDLQMAPVRTRSALDVPLILSVGRLVEKKGFADLLMACYWLKHEQARFRCVIYGDGPQSQALAKMVEQLDLSGHVTLAGARSRQEIVSAYLQADIFVLTPFVMDNGDRDGIPNVLIEAMACGLPVVTTPVGGIPELVRHDHNGLLATPRGVSEIAAHIALLIRDEDCRTRLGVAARHTVEEYFDARIAGGQLAELFEGLIWGSPDLQTA